MYIAATLTFALHVTQVSVAAQADDAYWMLLQISRAELTSGSVVSQSIMGKASVIPSCAKGASSVIPSGAKGALPGSLR